MDSSDAPEARQGDDGVGEACLDSATVVVDPELPKDIRDALARAGSRLVPYQGPVPAATLPTNSARGCAFLAGVFFVLAVLGALAGNAAFASTMVMLAATGIPFVLAGRPSAGEIAAALAPVTQHRHYVRPGTDIDADHWQLWKRAVHARNRIAHASVVSDGRIDSVQVTEVLPHRLWDVAQRLARLAEVRARQQEILGDVPPEDPDVAQAVTRQRRAQELALADVARRVSDLENVAELVDAADLAARKESIVRQLNELDDSHAELLAGIGDTALDANLTDRLADDATAVIEQARQAIEQANEAALNLALPAEAGDEAGSAALDEALPEDPPPARPAAKEDEDGS
jgi:hypothetical protein